MYISSEAPTLGALLRGLRSRQGWTLKEMSVKSGIPVSTLSKVEHGQLTLTYDKLYQLSQRLGMRMSELFAEEESDAEPVVTARRSLGNLATAVRVETPNYDYYYLCAELRRKRMIPVLARIRANTVKEFGQLVHHSGEEFAFVLKGSVALHTEFYDPVTLHAGESVYFDSSMGHAYLVPEGCEEAELLSVMAGGNEEEVQTALGSHAREKAQL
ncbi:XRE family transcriptional regulator [Massilia sp. KIM]|nr:XRE family transcriptional regulator [Massilia sp. KIM]